MASCEMPGVIPPHNAYLPASQLTPEARARQHKFQQSMGRCEHGFKQPHTSCEDCMLADYEAGQARLRAVQATTAAYWASVKAEDLVEITPPADMPVKSRWARVWDAIKG